MNENNKQFLKEFKKLIKNENESNKVITAEITEIKDNILYLSTKDKINIRKKDEVEINRISAVILKANKNIILKLSSNADFRVGQKVSIKNIQKDIIIQKLQETLDNIWDNKINKENKENLEVLLNHKEANYSTDKVYISNKLNKNQQISVIQALRTDKFHIIQGPPGTGKTHTIIEIIKELYRQDKRILITTHTNIALDNILERLDMINSEDILRIGRNDKISDSVRTYSLDEQIKNHPRYVEILKKEKEITVLENSSKVEVRNDYDNKSENIINKLFRKIFSIEENKSSLNNYIVEVNKTKNIERKSEILLEIDNIKNNIQSDIVKHTKIIASTIISSNNYLTRDMEFDYIIMDEASQVPVYLALIPLMKTDKFILIGDQKQLQPISNENSSSFLNKSIFNLLVEKYPENYTFLNIQYRMNHEICDIASKLYYDNKLLTGEIVKNNKISLEDHKSFLLNEDAITFINTSNINYHESKVGGGCCNKHESQLILSIVKALLQNNISEEEIGIISPYKKQKLYLQKLLDKEKINIECDTIYRFQGREKDVIILSFCKSSNSSLTKFQKYFLGNENQLNVSITRARKKLIIIANYDMLISSHNIKQLFDEISPLNTYYLEDLL